MYLSQMVSRECKCHPCNDTTDNSLYSFVGVFPAEQKGYLDPIVRDFFGNVFFGGAPDAVSPNRSDILIHCQRFLNKKFFVWRVSVMALPLLYSLLLLVIFALSYCVGHRKPSFKRRNFSKMIHTCSTTMPEEAAAEKMR